MYQALYRKYRPKSFDDVVGQDVIVKTLKNAIINNRLSHAYLFTGPRGTGKTSIAKIFAKTVNCLDLKEGIACDNCKNCLEINNKQNVDIIEIDAASNNGVDEIRELKSKVNLVPAVSKYKVYIIDEVHMLTTGAFNALLKTLEEPPSHVIFILATTEPHKIPTTILSRCQRFDFKKISNQKIYENLKKITDLENIKITDDALYEIAYISDGGMRDAISILDETIAYECNDITIEHVHDVSGTLTNTELKNFFENLISGDLKSLILKINKYDDDGKNFIKLTEEIINYLKNNLLNIIIPTNDFQDYQLNLNKDKIIELIEKFNESLNDMRKSTNPKLVFEIMIIKNISVNDTQNINIEEKHIEDEKINEKENIIEEITIINNEQKKEPLQEDINIIKKLDNNFEKIKELKEIRIENTLAKFNKQILNKIKEKIEELRPLVLNPDYSQYISILLDGNLKAASEENLIFVFDNEIESNYFNENIINIEKILNEQFNSSYKIISTDIDDWNKIKDEFNSKKRKYKYKEEKFNLEEMFSSDTNSKEKIEELFGSVVEYDK